MALTTMSEFTREKRYVIKSATCLIGSFAIILVMFDMYSKY